MSEYSYFVIISYSVAHALPLMMLLASILRRRTIVSQEKQHAGTP